MLSLVCHERHLVGGNEGSSGLVEIEKLGFEILLLVLYSGVGRSVSLAVQETAWVNLCCQTSNEWEVQIGPLGRSRKNWRLVGRLGSAYVPDQ